MEKSAEPAAKADKGKGKGKDKKGKAQTSGTTTPEKKTKLKRRDEIEPPTFIGRNICVMLLHEESLYSFTDVNVDNNLLSQEMNQRMVLSSTS